MHVLVFMTRIMHDGMGCCGMHGTLGRERKTTPRNTQRPRPELGERKIVLCTTKCVYASEIY
jgi:hypothetical protein